MEFIEIHSSSSVTTHTHTPTLINANQSAQKKCNKSTTSCDRWTILSNSSTTQLQRPSSRKEAQSSSESTSRFSRVPLKLNCLCVCVCLCMCDTRGNELFIDFCSCRCCTDRICDLLLGETTTTATTTTTRFESDTIFLCV